MSGPDPEMLPDLLTFKMPFGKHAGCPIADLPTSYLSWFARTGFPRGRLGAMLATMHEIRQHGLDALLDPFRAAPPASPRRRPER